MLESEPKIFIDTIVDNVKRERKIRSISQLRLAQILDFASPNYVAKIESRNHGVSYNLVHLCKIAEAFGMEVVDFIPSKKRL